MLREAYAERDRVLTETRQMSARLAEFQRSLGDVLRLASPPEAPPSPDVTGHAPVEPPPRTLTAEGSSPTSDNPGRAAIDELPTETDGGHEDEPEGLTSPPIEHQVFINNVESFVVASDLLDQVSRIPGIERTWLLNYEQNVLAIGVLYPDAQSLAALLKNELGFIELVDQNEHQMHFVYHATA